MELMTERETKLFNLNKDNIIGVVRNQIQIDNVINGLKDEVKNKDLYISSLEETIRSYENAKNNR